MVLSANPALDIHPIHQIAAVVLNGQFLDRTRLDDLLDEAERIAVRH